MKKYIVDTNFIIRYLLSDNEDQYKETKGFFESAREGKIQIQLEQSVFVEVIFVLSSFYEIPKEKIVATLHSLLSYKGLEAEKQLLQHALEIFQENNIHIVDAIVIARCNYSKNQVLTFDKKLKKTIKCNILP